MGNDIKKRVWEKILEFGISRLIEWMIEFLLATALGAGVLHLLSNVVSRLTPYKRDLVFLGAITGAFIFTCLYKYFGRNVPHFKRLSPDFLIEEKKLYYRYESRNKMTYIRKLRIRALKNQLVAFPDRYVWTGKGQINIRTANRNQIFRETTRMNIWQLYEVQLERSLKRGETTEIELIWNLEDSANLSQPFLATTIHDPTDYLIMQVALPRALLGTHQAICETRVHSAVLKSLDSKPLNFEDHDGEAVVTWEKKKPKLLHHYELRWSI